MESILIDNVHVPRFLYGTAWKEAETERLTLLAIQQGFRDIDTANQRRHYDEAAVGKALTTALQAGLVRREDLFIQTKFTFLAGQDHRLPYDPRAPIAEQVQQSFASSLDHLGVDAIDSYVLHGPSQRPGLGSTDWEAWHAMEAIHESGRARLLGVSNVTAEQLLDLCGQAKVLPRFVQNRCYAIQGWDHDVREACAKHGIVYQGFSLLTANRQLLARPEVKAIAARYGRTTEQIVFRFALEVGMIPLTGTTSADHMRTDLGIFDFQLQTTEIEDLSRLG